MFTYPLSERRHPFASAFQATFIHASLIAGAVFATKAGPTMTRHAGPVIDVFVPSIPRSRPVCACTVLVPAPTGTQVVDLVIPTIPVDAPPGIIPPVDPRTVVPGTGIDRFTTGQGDSLPATSVLAESQVDELPDLVAAGLLRYPTVLQAAGIEGSVTVRFIIDTTGRVEPDGLEVLAATQQGFVAAAKEAVLTSRFHPAMKAHRPVRVRVQQVINFKH